MFAKLGGAPFPGATLIKANLSSTELMDAELTTADLSGADLSSAHLKGARLGVASLQGADLRNRFDLTHKQVDEAFGDAESKLPAALTRPASWSSLAAPKNIP
jgi:uncharacterized protein YjbI with pentapeptide repeats